MKCSICGKEVPPEDPSYPNVHYDCSLKIQKEMGEIGMIEVIWRKGGKLAWKFSESFEKYFYKTLNFVREHIIHDETIDEDMIDMQGVIRAVMDYVPTSTSSEKVGSYAAFIFNSLMVVKYGSPLPEDKKFGSRVREFLTEVYSVPASEEEAKLFKSLKRKFNIGG